MISVGIDVSKGKSTVCFMKPGGEILKSSFEINHTANELESKSLPEYAVIREMLGIGDKLAPRIIAEIGDVLRFKNKHSLIAYAGIDAPPYQSGTFNASERHISERGNSYLRKTGFEIMQSWFLTSSKVLLFTTLFKRNAAKENVAKKL